MGNNCEDCIYHKEVTSKIQAIEQKQKDMEIVQKDQGKDIQGIKEKAAAHYEKIDNVLDLVKEIKIKVETVMQMPTQRWNTVTTVLITSAINGIIGVIILVLTGKL